MTYREARPGLRRGRVAAARELGNCGGHGRPRGIGVRGLPGEDAAVTSGRLGRTLDLASRGWWRLAGRRVDLDGDQRWLDAPVCGPGPGWGHLAQGRGRAARWRRARGRRGRRAAVVHVGPERRGVSRRRPGPGGPSLLRAHRMLADGGLGAVVSPIPARW